MGEGIHIRLANIIPESLVNGPGLRRVYFSQGCTHNCPGCFNLETHDFNGGQVYDVLELAQDVINNPIIKGVTFSGGDPFQQSLPFYHLARILKNFRPDIDIWAYTGYTFEYLVAYKYPDEMKKNGRDLLSMVDTLVDGRFDLLKKDENLKFRGSSNQRIIDVQKSLIVGETIERTEFY